MQARTSVFTSPIDLSEANFHSTNDTWKRSEFSRRRRSCEEDRLLRVNPAYCTNIYWRATLMPPKWSIWLSPFPMAKKNTRYQIQFEGGGDDINATQVIYCIWLATFPKAAKKNTECFFSNAVEIYEEMLLFQFLVDKYCSKGFCCQLRVVFRFTLTAPNGKILLLVGYGMSLHVCRILIL